MIRKKFITILGVVLLGGAVAVGWTSTALADEISYSFEVTLDESFGNLNSGDTLTGSWTVDTAAVIATPQLGIFAVTSFQVGDPQNGGTWTDTFSFPEGIAIVGNDFSSISFPPDIEVDCPTRPKCDLYVVGFDGENSIVSGNFAGVTSIEQGVLGGGGLTLADLGFGFVFEGHKRVLSSADHPTGDAFFSEMLLFTGGGFEDPAAGAEGDGVAFAETTLVSVSLSPSILLLDIKPGTCPNPLDVKSGGVLPAAILGTSDFDVTKVDIASVELEGISPRRSAIEDVAKPIQSFDDMLDALDCTTEGPDGFDDLTLKFENKEVVSALGALSDGDVLLLTLTGNLKAEFGGAAIEFQDVVVIEKK